MEVPTQLSDLYAEYRNRTNGIEVPYGNGLIGALTHYGLPAIDSTQKDAFHDLIITKSKWSDEEKHSILSYCTGDVDSTADLFGRMLQDIDLPYALLRGEFVKALARVECRGTPLDVDLLNQLEAQGPFIKARLIERVNEIYPIFLDGVFKVGRLK